MMNDRTSSMAQLSRWTESMQQDTKGGGDKRAQPQPQMSKGVPMPMPSAAAPSKPLAEAKHAPAIDEEYDEEGFEDYEEDFEQEPSPVKAKPAAAALAKPMPAQPTPYAAEQRVQQPERAPPPIAGDAKRTARDEPPASKPARGLRNDGISMSLARSIADPRLVRVQRILNSKVLEMASEKATLFTLMPSTPYDLYSNALRKADCPVKQMGVPVDLEVRDMESNTDEVGTANQSVQACYGDDTAFFKLLDDIRRRKDSRGESKEAREMPSSRSDGSSQGEASTLSAFLQRASNICEGIIAEENRSSNAGSESKSSRAENTLLESGSAWMALSAEQNKPENALLDKRPVTYVRFSPLQSNMMLAVHPHPVEQGGDMCPTKGLLSLFDIVSSPGVPWMLLACTGQPACCCFSSTQSHLVAAGTNDGSLHLWDLREPSALHLGSDALSRTISKGVRKPSYSTHLSLALDDLDDAQHIAGIVQIESLGESAQRGFVGVTSQFVSLDEAGSVVFWVTSEVSQRGAEDLKRSPWGRVLLSPTKQIHMQHLLTQPSVSNKNLTWLSDVSSLIPKVVLAALPGDSSMVLVGGWRGEVAKAVRVGEAARPKIFQRTGANCAHVTCISVRENVDGQGCALVLIGREDGTVDLFQTDSPHPITSWNIGALDKASSSQTNKVVLVRWMQIPVVPAVSFVAVSECGSIAHFNLLQDLYHPVQVENLGLKVRLKPYEVDVSTMRSRLDACRVVVCNGREVLSIKMRRLNASMFSNEKVADIESTLREHLGHLIGPAAAAKPEQRRSSDQEKK